MITLQIKHGFQSATRNYPQVPTVAQIKQDSALRAELGYGDNVRVLVNGVEQPDFAPCPGPVVSIETAANTKS